MLIGQHTELESMVEIINNKAQRTDLLILRGPRSIPEQIEQLKRFVYRVATPVKGIPVDAIKQFCRMTTPGAREQRRQMACLQCLVAGEGDEPELVENASALAEIDADSAIVRLTVRPGMSLEREPGGDTTYQCP